MKSSKLSRRIAQNARLARSTAQPARRFDCAVPTIRQRLKRPSFGRLAGQYGNILVVASEKMSRIVLRPPINRDTANLRLDFNAPLVMDGRTVILQAVRKIPRAIQEVLGDTAAGEVEAFLLHQANLNLIAKVAQALGVDPAKFFTNIRRYGNTSSASMLIAASEWRAQAALEPGKPVVFAAFGAGFHWGALAAIPC